MKILYFNPFAGISGDMCLGALVNAGCPIEEIKNQLKGLNIPGFDLQEETVQRGPLSGTYVQVSVQEEHHVHRTLSDVLEIVDNVQWPGNVREQIESVFTVLAHAEGSVHNKPYDKIHFHEVGSFDAIVDISGTLYALHLLGIEKCYVSSIQVGSGFSGKTRHGHLPLPVPAASYLLKGFELFSTGIEFELVTPTGAALLNRLCENSSPIPIMNLEQVGYGAGGRDLKEIPNLLRIFIGEQTKRKNDFVSVIESNIDDMNPEWFEPLMDGLFKAGALDVTLSPLTMKKARPATLLRVIAPSFLKDELAQLILKNSTSIGLRIYECERRMLQRKSVTVTTPWGEVKGKLCRGYGIEERFTPEYEECKRIHHETGISIQQIYHEVMHSFKTKQKPT